MNPEGKKNFFCPFCEEKLSFFNGDFIRLMGVIDTEMLSIKAVLFLPSGLGKYGAIFPEGLKLKDGAEVEFHCPECKKNLTTPFNSELAVVKMQDEKLMDFYVFFNKIYGKRATYVIDYTHKSLAMKFGSDAEDIGEAEIGGELNFFGA